MALEVDLIHSLITNKHIVPALKKLPAEYLQVPEVKVMYGFIIDYFKKYKSSPTPQQLKEKFPDYEHKVETTDVDYFIDRLIERRVETGLAEVLVQGSTKLKEDGGLKALNQIRQAIMKLNVLTMKDEDIDITQNTDERRERYIERSAIKGLIGIPTGLPSIDNITNGFKKKELITICGLTAVGKSFLTTCFAVNAWKEGYKVLFLTLEMSREQIEERFDCLAANLSHYELRRARLAQEELKRYNEYLEGLKVRPPFIVSSPIDCTQSVIFSKIQEHKPDICFVDYIDLIRDEKEGRDFYKTANIIGDLKMFANALNIPLVVVAQISRQNFSREVEDLPSLENIASSHRIPRDSDVVIAVHQTHKQQEDNIMMLGVIKNRDGKLLRKLDLNWDLDHGVIGEKNEKGGPII